MQKDDNYLKGGRADVPPSSVVLSLVANIAAGAVTMMCASTPMIQCYCFITAKIDSLNTYAYRCVCGSSQDGQRLASSWKSKLISSSGILRACLNHLTKFLT